MKQQPFLNLWVPIILGITLLVYVILRAALIPVTHDEANTCLTFSVKPVWDIITYSDPIPNNHILNTLLIKLFTGIFGMHAFIARLPNILGFILYYSVLVIWLRKLSTHFLIMLTGLVLFTCNPYLMDFFSLARGYALSIAFMLTSCYFAWRYIHTAHRRAHLYALIFGAVAVYTNFTTLNFFIAFAVLIFIVDIRLNYKSDRKLFYRKFGEMALVILLLAGLSSYPIYRMIATDQFVFWGTKGFYSDTLLTLFQASDYGQDYFHFQINWYVSIYLYLIFIMLVFAFKEGRRNKYKISENGFLFFVLLLTGTVLVNVLQYYLFHTPYLTTRTALFYYPLSMITLLFFVKFLYENYKAGFGIFSGVFIICGIFHMVNTVNLNSAYEWWYDKNTFDVIAELEEKNPDAGVISLDADWLFYPSLHFHIETDHHDKIDLRDFHTDIDSNSVSEYYYIVESDFNLLKNKYEIIKSYEFGTRLLLRKKEFK